MTQWAWFVNVLQVDNGLCFFAIFSVTTAKFCERLLSSDSEHLAYFPGRYGLLYSDAIFSLLPM